MSHIFKKHCIDLSLKKNILVLLICLITATTYSQNFGIGASAIYNFQTESFGAGIRAEFPVNRFSIVPQVAFYPGFNKINEYYAGVGIHCNLFSTKKFTFYALLGGAYNGWINYKDSPINDAKYSNWDLEGGLGIKTNRCLHPFLEYRYNLHWKETNLQLGLMYFFHCKNSGSSSGGKQHRNVYEIHYCPAYND